MGAAAVVVASLAVWGIIALASNLSRFKGGRWTDPTGSFTVVWPRATQGLKSDEIPSGSPENTSDPHEAVQYVDSLPGDESYYVDAFRFADHRQAEANFASNLNEYANQHQAGVSFKRDGPSRFEVTAYGPTHVWLVSGDYVFELGRGGALQGVNAAFDDSLTVLRRS